ncbi:hypothetical protein R70006_04898 [Paraburkholderia domus]|uniref:hypothetical protein n=1 Tax=Paraburkholderia domus TaxID=2793075 RepID=UPI0019126310|nr:hypothetical protein [Paraburkholderia domus]MBK5051580.1 hypothetical protein [Burkholderia sp. R-70006]CAE6792043.1 hypothetical protein R70006_04898 [Paraburkholderia domus]CAE6796024.1 hypothetical protein R75483_05120 [Paraburkholderia domus]
MSLFQYPKSKHVRKFGPPTYKHYQTYKRWLQAEFSRVCVYCRQPDSSSPNLNFGVDHYKPKGDSRFGHLLCSYGNLYYCCGSCNSRKNDDWPTDEKAGPYVVNPCDHEMADHLRFNVKSGRIEPRSSNGTHTEKLLQLNDVESIKYRNNTFVIIRALEAEIARLDAELKESENCLSRGIITQAEHDADAISIRADRDAHQCVIFAQNGGLPLALSRKQQNYLAPAKP